MQRHAGVADSLGDGGSAAEHGPYHFPLWEFAAGSATCIRAVADGWAMSDVADDLKAAMRRMPGPVALVTTADPRDGGYAGLAASAVIPVSMDPPSMLVAVNRGASAHGVIERAGRFCLNLLCNSQTDLVSVFGNSARRAERFTGDLWADREGLPYLPGACFSIFCTVAQTQPFGTHELFIGTVDAVLAGTGTDPMGWIEGGFARLQALEALG
jgi:flavin reductase (DIM6/NTAB) family NADH-FMN oxidoreductase RutF